MTVLELPLPPNVANSSWHWAVKRRKKAEYEKIAYWTAFDQTRGKTFPSELPQKVRVSLHFRTWNACDEDNLVARAKWPIDALKGAYYVDDDPKHLELGDITQEVNRKNRGVRVTIEDVS